MSRSQRFLRAARHSCVWTFLSLFLPLLALGHIGHSYAAVIYADPSLIGQGDPVGTFFPGLTFSAVPVTGHYSGTTVITQMTQIGPALGPVVGYVSTFYYFDPDEPSTGFSLQFGNPSTAMRVDFASKLFYVSVNFLPDDTDTGVLQAYSVDNVLLGEAVGRGSVPFTLSLMSSNAPFSYILATYGDSGFIGRVGYEVAAIPEPETLALMLSGLALIGFIARRRKQAITEARPR